MLQCNSGSANFKRPIHNIVEEDAKCPQRVWFDIIVLNIYVSSNELLETLQKNVTRWTTCRIVWEHSVTTLIFGDSRKPRVYYISSTQVQLKQIVQITGAVISLQSLLNLQQKCFIINSFGSCWPSLFRLVVQLNLYIDRARRMVAFICRFDELPPALLNTPTQSENVTIRWRSVDNLWPILLLRIHTLRYSADIYVLCMRTASVYVRSLRCPLRTRECGKSGLVAGIAEIACVRVFAFSLR